MSKQQETELNRQAFEHYYSLGDDRSYSKVAIKLKKSLSTIEKWGKMFGWKVKVDERDAKVLTKANDQVAVEQQVDYLKRNISICKFAIGKGFELLKNNKMKVTVKDLLSLMETEHKLRTGVDSTVEIKHTLDVKNMSTEELQDAMKGMMKTMLGIQGLKSFSELEKPVEAEYKIVKEKKEEEINE